MYYNSRLPLYNITPILNNWSSKINFSSPNEIKLFITTRVPRALWVTGCVISALGSELQGIDIPLNLLILTQVSVKVNLKSMCQIKPLSSADKMKQDTHLTLNLESKSMAIYLFLQVPNYIPKLYKQYIHIKGVAVVRGSQWSSG